MASNWEKPGFEVVMVAAECTAYSGGQTPMHRPTIEPGTDGAADDQRLSRSESPLPCGTRSVRGH
jgi:hypothetical protein